MRNATRMKDEEEDVARWGGGLHERILRAVL
jgi:hypothetical protein